MHKLEYQAAGLIIETVGAQTTNNDLLNKLRNAIIIY